MNARTKRINSNNPSLNSAGRQALALFGWLALWVAIAATLWSFWRVRILAGLLLVPYLAWVSFAAVLNFTIWQLNL